MSTKWKNVEKANVILKSLESYLEHRTNGNVGYGSLRHQDDIPALISLARFTQEIPDVQKERIVRTAVSEAKKAGNFHHGFVGEAIKRGESLYLQLPLKSYSLLTTISIKYPGTVNPVKFQKSYITFYTECPKNFDIAPIMRRASGLIQGELPRNYMYVKVSLKARCDYAAADLAFDELNYLRGIWNLARNRSRGFTLYGGRPRPLNDILLGPFQTLHTRRGKLATGTYWWDPSYQTPKKPFDLTQGYDTLKSYEKLIRRYVSKSKYGSYIKRVLIKYVHALDDPDMSGAFMKLWSMLEYATRTRKNENYSTTVKRILFIFKENKQYHEIHLDELREERNRIAHHGSQSQRGQEALFQLMQYANAILMFLIDQSCRFKQIPSDFVVT